MEQALYAHPEAYDALYAEKDYEGEVAFVIDRFEALGNGGSAALVVGCGTGGHSVHLVERGFDVVGIDPNPAMIERAREKVDASFRVGGLPDLDVEGSPGVEGLSGVQEPSGVEGPFDLVWAPYTVLNYLEPDEVGPAVRALSAATADDGVVVVDVGDFHATDAPAFQVADGPGGGCARLSQFRRVDDDHVRMDALVFFDGEWFADRHVVTDVDPGAVAHEFTALGYSVETHDWYGSPTSMDDPTVIVAHGRGA